MDEKVYSFLGLAAKAGKLLSGEEACEKGLKSGKGYLVIVLEDASDNTRRKFETICSNRGVEISNFGEKALLGKYSGKGLRSVIVVMEKGFAGRLKEMISIRGTELGGV